MTITEREIILVGAVELLLEEGKSDKLLWLASILIIVLVAIMLYLGLYALDLKFLVVYLFLYYSCSFIIDCIYLICLSKLGIDVVPIVFSVVLLSSWVDGEMFVWINVFLLWIVYLITGLSASEMAIFTLQIFTLSVLIYRATDFKGKI